MAIAKVANLPTSGTLGVNTNTQTVSFNATGCDAITIGATFTNDAANVAGDTITAATYNGVAFTELIPETFCVSGNTNFISILGLLLPASGSNNAVLTFSHASANSHIVPIIVGWSGVASFGNTWNGPQPGATSTTGPTVTLNCAIGNVGFFFHAHGDSTTGVDGTSTLIITNNYNNFSSGGSAVAGYKAGAGASTTSNATSGTNDHWTSAGVELVASGGGGITIVNQPATIWAQSMGLR